MCQLTKSIRARAAIFIALIYAVCALTPPAAVAFAVTPASFHYLAASDGSHDHANAAGIAHAHANAAHHDQNGEANYHPDADGTANDEEGCCGLFCFSAIAHEPNLDFAAQEPGAAALSVVANCLTGRGPSPLHRPPIA